jgi:transcriptional regulator with XRE-family HTH domain
VQEVRVPSPVGVKALTHFGQKLRRLRNSQGLTQEELAFRADLSVVYLRGLEGGRFNPTFNVLFDLGRGLGVHPSTLLEGIPVNAETREEDRKRPGPKAGFVKARVTRKRTGSKA